MSVDLRTMIGRKRKKALAMPEEHFQCRRIKTIGVALTRSEELGTTVSAVRPSFPCSTAIEKLTPRWPGTSSSTSRRRSGESHQAPSVSYNAPGMNDRFICC